MDYIIADKTLISPELQPYATQRRWSICPIAIRSMIESVIISDRQFTRQELGLPEHGFVFCCFNNNYKILPATLQVGCEF
jgi:protein O-GlcNAc transferase